MRTLSDRVTIIGLTGIFRRRFYAAFSGCTPGKVLRHRVISAATPRMAAQNTANRQIAAAQLSVAVNRFKRIFGARRHEAAAGPQKGRDKALIKPDQKMHGNAAQSLPIQAAFRCAWASSRIRDIIDAKPLLRVGLKCSLKPIAAINSGGVSRMSAAGCPL